MHSPHDLSPEMLAQAAEVLGVTEHALLTDPGCEVEAMTAAAIVPLKPPRGWLEMAEPDEPTPWTVLASGQAYGHAALWETCHTGFLSSEFNQCIKPPRSESGYAWFHTGSIETDDGAMVAAGVVTYGGTHAPTSMTLQAAAAHYDNTSHVGAYVRASNGRHGIWLAGAAKSDITPEGLRDLRANPPSGDWRPWKGSLEMIAALAVPVQGFPVPRAQLALSASGISALILPGVMEEDLVEPRSKEYMRRRHALTASIEA